MQLSKLLFTAESLAILRGACWDANARREFDTLSGGFFWSDELLREASIAPENWAHRAIIGYRASLIDGQPREELRGGWDQLLRECPDWPGFRPERCDLALKDEQELAHHRFMRRLEALDRLLRRKGPAER